MYHTQLADLAGQLDEPQPVFPPVPHSVDEAGLPASLLEQLILKILHFRGEIVGRDLSLAIGLKFSVIDGVVEYLKRSHLVQVKRSLGMGNVSAVFALTEAGRTLAHQYLEANQYAGKAPVPLAQYTEMVRAQRRKEGWLSLEMLESAYQHMVVTPEILAQIGPAVSSGKSFLIYGQPGNGKTYLAEALFDLDESFIYVPYAIESHGQIIQMYDPIYHRLADDNAQNSLALAVEDHHDGRWFRCRRPFIISGGELALEMLDLSYNQTARFYDAPLQLKANNGIYMIDDFGRQKVTPAEVLNRWIVPMERKVDYLTFVNGTKIHVPFETFLIFSTNLNPEKLGDEAFLRRIQYKMLMRSPSEDEFLEIFRRCADSRQLGYERDLPQWFLQKFYRNTGKVRRRCHPRDVLTHAIGLIQFERRPWVLTRELMERAFDSCFVNTRED